MSKNLQIIEKKGSTYMQNFTNTEAGPRAACDAMVTTDNFREDRIVDVRQACYDQFSKAPSPTWFKSAVQVSMAYRVSEKFCNNHSVAICSCRWAAD